MVGRRMNKNAFNKSFRRQQRTILSVVTTLVALGLITGLARKGSK